MTTNTKKDHLTPAERVRGLIDYWAACCGSLEPTVFITQEQADWLQALSTEHRQVIDTYAIRRFAEEGLDPPIFKVVAP